MSIPAITSFAGFKAREIIQYRKCELCEKLFNSPDMPAMLQREAHSGLNAWHREASIVKTGLHRFIP